MVRLTFYYLLRIYYVTRDLMSRALPLSRLIFSYEAETWVHFYIFYLLKLITYLSYNLRYYLQYRSSLTKLRLTTLGRLRLEFKTLHTSCYQEILLNGIELATLVSDTKLSGCHPAEVACSHRCYIIPQFVNDATQRLAISRDIELCVGRHNESRVSSRLDP